LVFAARPDILLPHGSTRQKKVDGDRAGTVLQAGLLCNEKKELTRMDRINRIKAGQKI